MYNVVAVEDFGTPAVVLVNNGFVNDAHSAASGKGLPGLRVVPETVICESNDAENIESGVSAVMDEIIVALTRPLTLEETTPRKEVEKSSRIIFKGSLSEVNQFFYRRGWTDGLPIVPPTEEAVAEMLTGTDLPADHVVTKLIPRMGKATVEKIAVNAVMAGALPTYMPVLIAVVQALMDRKARFDVFEVSTGSWAPFMAINGPIRNDIHINCSSGALSPGNMANAAIGRAVGLIVKNIGGARKAVEDMGVIGNPEKYSLVLGENEEECPWEPLHVQRGFKKEDSTITVFLPNSFTQTIPGDSNAKGVAEALARMGAGGMSCFIVNPPNAKILAEGGWTREKLQKFLAEKAVLPPQADQNAQPRPTMAPEYILVVVAGGPGVFMAMLRSAGGGSGGGFNNAFVTRKVELPKDWDKLVARYKNLIPVYARY
ncbi:hypothetical protein ACFLYN_00765 [Chloroflexota bacterium]